MTKRVIISGATGLIGRALSEDLIEAGYDVVGLSRDPSGTWGVPYGVRLVAWDGRSVGTWADEVDGAHAIVNLAGESLAQRWSDQSKERILRSRVEATRAIAEAVQEVGRRPEVLIQASAVGYYGPRGAEPVTADSPPGDDFLARVCVEWEAASEPVTALGVRRAIVRSGIVLSKKGGALPPIVLPIRLFVGGPMAGGRQHVPWIHIADEVGAIRFLIEDDGASGAYNLTAPESVTQAEFARTAGHVLGRPTFVPAPGFAIKLVLGEMSTMVLDGQNAVPQRLEAAGYAFRFPALEPALRDVLG